MKDKKFWLSGLANLRAFLRGFNSYDGNSPSPKGEWYQLDFLQGHSLADLLSRADDVESLFLRLDSLFEKVS